MLHRLEALSRKFQVTVWRLLRLLDERMQNDDTLTEQKTIKRTPNPGVRLWAQFKKAVAKRTGVRQAKVRTMRHQ